VEDRSAPHRAPVLPGVLQPLQVDAVLKSVDVPIQRTDSDPRLKPTFVPEFHGFEMFVWSMLSPKVETSLQLPAMQVTFIRRSLCSRRSLGSAK
jgi:hypothetical protein